MKNILATIEVPTNLVNYLESLHYETNCRSSLLAFMISKDMGNNPSFKEYNDEYREFFMKYEIAKQQLYNDYVKADWDGQDVNWELNFFDKKIYITEN